MKKTEGGLRKRSQYFLNNADTMKKKRAKYGGSTSEGHHLEFQRSALRGSSHLARVMRP